MGFLDKAKKLADQAQTKLDEVQKDFNAKQGTGSGGPSGGGAAVEYDQHGRPVSATPPSAAPSPRPASGPATAGAPGVPDAPADKSPTIDPSMPTSADPEPAKRHGDPLLNDEPGSRQGPPPSSSSGLSSGDPLAG